MTILSELASFLPPSPYTIFADFSNPHSPTLPSCAPSHPLLSFPPSNGQPTLLLFLRHCGCPFAESSFLRLRSLAAAHAQKPNGSPVVFVAVSHSSARTTESWLAAIGGAGDVSVLVDEERQLYRAWGLGYVGPMHLFNMVAVSEGLRLRGEGVGMRATESGSRWVRGGRWAINGEGMVVWGGGDESAEGGGEGKGLVVGLAVLEREVKKDDRDGE